MKPVNLSVLQQGVTLGELLDARSFTDVCQSFADLYRVGVRVFDAHGAKLADVRAGSADFCSYVTQDPDARALCAEASLDVKQGELDEGGAVGTVTCFAGCRYVAKAIVYQGDVIGRIVLGPFVPEDLMQLPWRPAESKGEFEATVAQAHLEKIRHAPEAMVAKTVQHFADIVDVLVFTGHKNLLTGQLHVETVQESYRELQEKNRQLENSLAKLRELDRLKSNFLATMSHELRTPLTSVIGYSEMMLDGLGGPLTKEQREYLTTIMEKGESLLQLITSVLDVTKIEAGRVKLVLSDVDLDQLIEDAVGTMLPLARKKSLNVVVKPSRLPPVQWDADKMRQAVVNLVSNAVKFTPPNGTVTVGAASYPGDRVAVTVTDDGIGIAPDHHEKIWDVFYQVDGSQTREYGGVGLGLAIVKSFVEGHGGEVAMSSIPGHGSEFTIILPQRAALVGPTRSAYAIRAV